MAVCHLKSVQRQMRSSPKPPQESTTKYRDGYTECANEVSRFVNNVQVLQPDVKQKLIVTCQRASTHSTRAPELRPARPWATLLHCPLPASSTSRALFLRCFPEIDLHPPYPTHLTHPCRPRPTDPLLLFPLSRPLSPLRLR
ncbi:hairy enhancer of split 5-like [Tropilaelaps mercedesae]|uniref:Hairy enhancer of split 5-like n=1 Tax=Tropilaelaps mercedesae TaxID=418985 RepID=A0A1V9X011_9ACAR|nr:hairy enhancer of split 5-like [Tropilaelaps mercedesae]